MADNTITVVGNLTRDPELRFTTGGRGVASFGIAVGRRYQVNGEWQEQTSYFNITAWGTLGENAAATLTKGSRVIVTGRLEQREYTNRDGDKRTAIEIVADEHNFDSYKILKIIPIINFIQFIISLLVKYHK